MEIRYEVKTIQVDHVCPRLDCGGLLRPTGKIYGDYNKIYQHECNICNYRETFNVEYPYLVHEKIPELKKKLDTLLKEE